MLMNGLVWKVDRSKRYEEDLVRVLSPRPPTGARGFRKQHSGPEGEHSESSESVSPKLCPGPVNIISENITFNDNVNVFI